MLKVKNDEMPTRSLEDISKSYLGWKGSVMKKNQKLPLLKEKCSFVVKTSTLRQTERPTASWKTLPLPYFHHF